MASLRKKPRSPYWFACFQLAAGRRTQRSTKLTDRKAALKLACRWETEARRSAGRPPPPPAREVRSDLLLARPQRMYLSTQMVAALRQGIEQGTWREYLPSERRLSETLQVSRPTVRTAIHLLAREGLVQIRHGRRNRIVPVAPGAQPKARRLVAIIMQQEISVLSVNSYQVISELRGHLASRGFESEIFFCPARGAAAQRRSLEAFVRQNRVFCCVLFSVRRELQQWFSSHSIPALIVGSCHATVRLPSLDLDYWSVGRHAGGVLLGKGHRRLGLIVTDVGMGGDLASEEGFREAVAERVAANEATLAVVHAGGAASEINRKLDVVFNSQRAPTALFVLQPSIVAIVLIYLLRRGLRVPEDVSLISRDPEKLFLAIQPQITHYTFEVKPFNHRLTRLMLRMVSHGELPPEPSLVVPQFFAGGTVAPPPVRPAANG